MIETRTAFHDDLAEISGDVARLGALARDAIETGSEAFLHNDLKATEVVIANDRALDDLGHVIETKVSELLARQQPVATDLRLLVTALRMGHDLERIGDNMVNIAKATRRLYPRTLDPGLRALIQSMREQAAAELNVAMTAFVGRDATMAAALGDMDESMDQLQTDMFRAIFQSHAAEEAAIQMAVQIALVGRYFERVGDLSVDIGERVLYLVTGAFPFETPQDTPPDRDTPADPA